MYKNEIAFYCMCGLQVLNKETKLGCGFVFVKGNVNKVFMARW